MGFALSQTFQDEFKLSKKENKESKEEKKSPASTTKEPKKQTVRVDEVLKVESGKRRDRGGPRGGKRGDRPRGSARSGQRGSRGVNLKLDDTQAFPALA